MKLIIPFTLFMVKQIGTVIMSRLMKRVTLLCHQGRTLRSRLMSMTSAFSLLHILSPLCFMSFIKCWRRLLYSMLTPRTSIVVFTSLRLWRRMSRPVRLLKYRSGAEHVIICRLPLKVIMAASASLLLLGKRIFSEVLPSWTTVCPAVVRDFLMKGESVPRFLLTG